MTEARVETISRAAAPRLLWSLAVGLAVCTALAGCKSGRDGPSERNPGQSERPAAADGAEPRTQISPSEDASSTAEQAPASIDGTPLGEFPYCEISAALALPGGGRWLLADNEEHKALLRASIGDDGALEVNAVFEMPSKRRPRDIEALALLGDDQDKVLVVGSASRNKHCEDKPKRARMRLLRLGADTLDELHALDVAEITSRSRTKDGCLSALIDPESEGAHAVCAEISVSLAEPGSHCKGIDIEGAAAHQSELLLGLRTPLVDGKAVILHHSLLAVEERGELGLASPSLVDLGGYGIRELVDEGESVLIVAGPTADTNKGHRLYRWSVGEPAGTLIRDDLPAKSEAIVLTDDAMLALTDGDQGDASCIEPAQSHRLPSQ